MLEENDLFKLQDKRLHQRWHPKWHLCFERVMRNNRQVSFCVFVIDKLTFAKYRLWSYTSSLKNSESVAVKYNS